MAAQRATQPQQQPTLLARGWRFRLAWAAGLSGLIWLGVAWALG